MEVGFIVLMDHVQQIRGLWQDSLDGFDLGMEVDVLSVLVEVKQVAFPSMSFLLSVWFGCLPVCI